tara:strand:- start:24079 stop:25257 length:1179 start_codon:yes stop_codon:yes gene_type:complete
VNNVVVLSAVRSAVGTFGGGLSEIEPTELGVQVLKEAIKRSGLEASRLETATIGNCIPTESRSPYLARVISVGAGMPMESIALTVNRLCGSAMQGIVSTAQSIMLGDVNYGVGGGVEVMSKGGYLSTSMRSGARMGDTKLVDLMVATLTDPFGVGHMGITAENLAQKWNITRGMQDEFALISQQRALNALRNDIFNDEIVPIEIKHRKGTISFCKDEHPRETTFEKLNSMRPVFKKEGGTVTAGNASGINDGASFVVLASEKAAELSSIKPVARLVSYGVSGVPNDLMGEGPIPATKLALKKAGLTLENMDVIESNEAFAAQALSVSKALNFNPEITNINGGAIALGHPVGATGAIIVTKAIHELKRRQGKFALATMCIGGGQGISTIFERV